MISGYIQAHANIFSEKNSGSHSYKLKQASLTRPFIEGATQKGQRKEHCMCIKQKQNISSQSLLHNPSMLKSFFQFVWILNNEFDL